MTSVSTNGDATDVPHDLVLVVDDDEATRQSLLDILSSDGFRAIGAGRADEALDMVVVHEPTAVVVDYQLPDQTGIELADRIKKHNADIPILLLTGFASLDTAIAAVGWLDAYLIKPVAPLMFLASVRDAITRRRRREENRILVERLEQVNVYQSLHDPLTGLPNRTLLDQRLEEALADCRRTDRRVAVLFVDLDRFNVVNDLFGHQAGDRILRDIADRLTRSSRKFDVVARFGGDEFVVVCPAVSSAADACLVAANVLEELNHPATVDGVQYAMTGSIGIAVTEPGAPQDTAETLLRNADTAMYRAKEAGRARWELFDNAMRVSVMERFEIERGLRKALDDGHLAVVYQAVVDVQAGTLVGAEALLRWDRPGHGTLSPGTFLAVAEDVGLLGPIGAWVLDTTLSDLAQWQKADNLPDDFRLWVNVSPTQLADPEFAMFVHDRLEVHGISPDLLGFEILEEALLNVKEAEKVLAALRAMGVSLNLDDFGSGHSNLWQLQELPITGLKIDRRFISTLGAPDDRESAIARGLVGLAHALDLTVVAEGVENAAQAVSLYAMGCEYAQGFFYGFPGSPEQLWQLADHWESERQEMHRKLKVPTG